jgi:hypothetical protein
MVASVTHEEMTTIVEEHRGGTVELKISLAKRTNLVKESTFRRQHTHSMVVTISNEQVVPLIVKQHMSWMVQLSVFTSFRTKGSNGLTLPVKHTNAIVVVFRSVDVVLHVHTNTHGMLTWEGLDASPFGSENLDSIVAIISDEKEMRVVSFATTHSVRTEELSFFLAFSANDSLELSFFVQYLETMVVSVANNDETLGG